MDDLIQIAKNRIRVLLEDSRTIYTDRAISDYAERALGLYSSGKANSLDIAVNAALYGRGDPNHPKFPFLVRIEYREESSVGDMRFSRSGTDTGIVYASNQDSAEEKTRSLYAERRGNADLKNVYVEPIEGQSMMDLKFFIP